jgi:glycine dehydrogenase subunit 1
MGPQGMREVAELCLQKAAYARQRFASSGRLQPAFEKPVFKEFVLRDRQNAVAQLLADAERAGIFAGVPLGRWYSELSDCLLVTVTEKRTREEIDRFVEFVEQNSNNKAALHA